MSHRAVQRVIVRMLYDVRFAEQVRLDATGALGGLDLTSEERGWLVQSEPRAWQVDPMRRPRTLKALLDEYPVSAALVLRHRGGTSLLDRFFSSEAFHSAIQQRRSLPLVFGPWLPALGVHEATATSALEHAIAISRRPRPAPPAGHLGLAPGVATVRAPRGTLALFTHCSARLHAAAAAGPEPQDPVTALLSDLVQLGALPSLDRDEDELLLVEPGPEGPAVAPVSPPLFGLLDAASAPAALTDVLAVARRHGAARGEDAEIVQSFVDEGLLLAG